MQANTAAEYLALALHGYGIDHVFFVPFVAAPALAAMEDLGIRRVSTHSELAAVYMADGYARAAHRPGVCFAQSVGAANAAAALREPYLGGSPVIALTGGPHPDTRYRHLYQEVEDFPMFTPVTKANLRLDAAGRLPDLLRQAFRVATTGAPGPVHVELAGKFGEVLNAPGELAGPVEAECGRYPAHRPVPDPAALQAAADALTRAARPVIVCGGGVVASGAEADLVSLAERLQIPVVTSLNGKEAIRDDHPLAVGLAGSYGRWCANQLLCEADLVFWAGSRAGGMVTENWKAPPPGTPSLQLDIEPTEIGRNYPASVGLVGDARAALAGLLDIAEPMDRSGWVARARSLVAAWRAEVEPFAASEAVPLRPERLCRELAAWLPANGVLVSDTGHAAQWTGSLVGLAKPGQRYIRCAGTLGWGLPGAIGVQCALPDRPVVLFTGDGALYYHLSELETMARLDIRLVVLVNNNGSLSQVRRGFDAAYGGRQRGHAEEMWRYRPTRFDRLAEEFGCLGIRVEHPGEIGPALERAVTSQRPTVIDVATDLYALPLGPWHKEA